MHEEPQSEKRFITIGDGSGLEREDRFHRQELQLAFRNRGMPLEGLRYPITPTGMHYLLIHFDIPDVDVNTWRLEVQGLVARPLSLALKDVQSRPAVTIPVTMECAGNGRALLSPRSIGQPWLVEAIGTAEWTGIPLRRVLEDAGVDDRAVEILFTGLDRGVQGDEVQAYQRSLSLAEAMRDEVLLAYAMNGAPLQPQHGFPLRLLVPGWYGMASVKWLTRIEAIPGPFQGYQMDRAYLDRQSRDGPGERVTLIRPRALLIPPGIPDFLTRTRLVEAGSVSLAGRAWAGRRGVARVDVSTDGGATWQATKLGEPLSPFAWRPWSYAWQARPGRYTLCARATDTAGEAQQLDPRWNFEGVRNNMVQRVEIVVE
ncbi:MAG TPA: sulfite oxidase [Anaeromyxobacter sp.]